MSGRLTEERMSCNSERVLVLRSLNECISAETKSVAASIQSVCVAKNDIRVRDLLLRDMIFLGAWKMGLGYYGEIRPSMSPPSLARI